MAIEIQHAAFWGGDTYHGCILCSTPGTLEGPRCIVPAGRLCDDQRQHLHSLAQALLTAQRTPRFQHRPSRTPDNTILAQPLKAAASACQSVAWRPRTRQLGDRVKMWRSQDSLCQNAALHVAGAFPPEHPSQPLLLVGVQLDPELPRGRLRLAQALSVLDALQDSL